jgi:phage tail protein X
MNRMTKALFGTAILASIASQAMAQHPPMDMPPGMGPGGMGPMGMHGMMHGPRELSANFDPAQLPELKGVVQQYTLAPWGEVDGLILADGTEVELPPHHASEVVFSIRPGDHVTIHGLKSRTGTMIEAVSIANDASGVVIGAKPERHRQEVTGVVKATLHTPHGEPAGVLLQDGTVVRLPPPSALHYAAMLAPGQTLVVRGEGITSPLGHVIAARQIGQSADKLVEIGRPHMMERMHEKKPADVTPK